MSRTHPQGHTTAVSSREWTQNGSGTAPRRGCPQWPHISPRGSKCTAHGGCFGVAGRPRLPRGPVVGAGPGEGAAGGHKMAGRAISQKIVTYCQRPSPRRHYPPSDLFRQQLGAFRPKEPRGVHWREFPGLT